MGIDFLDCIFRLSKAFKLPDRAFDITKLNVPLDKRGVFAGPVKCADILHWVERTLRENGRVVPEDCWPRVRECIGATVSVPVEKVTLESRLVEDLGFT